MGMIRVIMRIKSELVSSSWQRCPWRKFRRDHRHTYTHTHTHTHTRNRIRIPSRMIVSKLNCDWNAY